MLFIIAAALIALIWIVNKLQASGTIAIPEFFQKLLGTIGGVDEVIKLIYVDYSNNSVYLSFHIWSSEDSVDLCFRSYWSFAYGKIG